MSGLPGLKVEIESSTPGTWYDISAYVKLPSEVSIERGRRDEEDAIDASYVKLELNNADGRFTYGAAGYQIRTDQRLRITTTVGATVSPRFVGYVQDWPIVWLSPVGNYAKADIVATDRMARLARRDVASLVQGEIIADKPAAYYTLGEPAEATAAGDTSGNGAPPMNITGSGSPVVFGEATGPVDGLTAADFDGDPSTPGQTLLLAADFPAPWTIECFFSTSYAGASGQQIVRSAARSLASAGSIVINGGSNTLSAGANAVVATTAAAVNDGQVHHAALTMDAAGTFVAYFDGASIGSNATGVPRTLQGVQEGPLTAGVSHVAITPTALSASRISQHASAGLKPALDSTDSRIARYATYAGIASSDQSLESGATRAVTAPVDTSKMLDAMQEVATTEGGTVFFNGAGSLVFQSRTHRVFASTATAKMTLAAEFINADNLTVSADKQYLVNTITGTRPDGAVQAAQNAASIALYEQYPDTQTLLVTTDQEVLDSIQWQVSAYSTPKPRVPSFTLDLLTLSAAMQQAALGLEIGDRIVITTLPSQSPLTTLDLIVEGWLESYQDDEWSMTFNTSPADLFRAWILEDATYGVLETTTRLYY